MLPSQFDLPSPHKVFTSAKRSFLLVEEIVDKTRPTEDKTYTIIFRKRDLIQFLNTQPFSGRLI